MRLVHAVSQHASAPLTLSICCAAVQTMLPCSRAQAEAKPVSASYSVVVSAPIDCLWSALDSPEAALYPGVLVRPLLYFF